MAAADKIPLRERKYAQTKLALMRAALERLERKSLEDISVKELCEAALVSEATFFNYFPRKPDLLSYYMQLWTLELNWHGRQEGERGLAAIAALFRRAARRIQERPGLMGEIVAHQARQREKPQPPEISRAERLAAFPDLEGVADLPASGLDAILVPNLQHAIEHGELPPNTHLHTVLVALISIFYGVPLTLLRANPEGIASMYLQQLAVLWAGLRSVANPRS